ncbi:MAG: hypothetical protein KJN60_12995, partial [Boseongicola sp.]|nr:hypothetical protein [Boseongicola sp.]
GVCMATWEELKAMNKQIARQKADKPKRVFDPPRPPPKPSKWDHLKDYPGQHLSEREFRARLAAFKDAQRKAHLAQHENYLLRVIAHDTQADRCSDAAARKQKSLAAQRNRSRRK